MAVQAQCSSNILLLNRNIQEPKTQIGNNYSLPPQPGGGVGVTASIFDHQLHANYSERQIGNNNFLNNPVGIYNTNQGKRRREDDMNQYMSNVHQRSQLQSRNNVDVSTGLHLAFNDQQQQHSVHPQSSGFVSPSSEHLSNLINQQEDEIQRYLQAQGEELRRKLADKRQRHYHALISATNESASRMISEKEAMVERAAKRNAELEARASQLSMEARVWEAKATAHEAVAAALQTQLQQAIITERTRTGPCEEEVVGGDVEDAESSYIDPERVVVVSGPGCKACGKRVASVVLLPCRHLCVCSECDDVLQACPLCLSLRSSSIEVYLS